MFCFNWMVLQGEYFMISKPSINWFKDRFTKGTTSHPNAILFWHWGCPSLHMPFDFRETPCASWSTLLCHQAVDTFLSHCIRGGDCNQHATWWMQCVSPSICFEYCTSGFPARLHSMWPVFSRLAQWDYCSSLMSQRPMRVARWIHCWFMPL